MLQKTKHSTLTNTGTYDTVEMNANSTTAYKTDF